MATELMKKGQLFQDDQYLFDVDYSLRRAAMRQETLPDGIIHPLDAHDDLSGLVGDRLTLRRASGKRVEIIVHWLFDDNTGSYIIR